MRNRRLANLLFGQRWFTPDTDLSEEEKANADAETEKFRLAIDKMSSVRHDSGSKINY